MYSLLYISCLFAVVLGCLAYPPGSDYNVDEPRYHGPPAPLNPDGTVAYTQDFAVTSARLRETHRSNHAQQLALIAEQEALAQAAGFDSQETAPLWGNHVEESHHGHSGHYASGGKYRGPLAPLNPDGTVAHTREYLALAKSHGRVRRGAPALTPQYLDIASQHQAAYRHQLGILARQEELALAAGPDHEDYQQESAYHLSGQTSHHHKGQLETAYPASLPYYQKKPAPLHPDGTVAHTPEYQAIAAAHAALHKN